MSHVKPETVPDNTLLLAITILRSVGWGQGDQA